MARRYCDYSDLSAGRYKPYGTLGIHCADVEVLADRKVVRGCNGDVVTLRPGDVLGYDCGDVWRVPPPRDRLQAEMRRLRLSSTALERGDRVEVSEWYSGTDAGPAVKVHGDRIAKLVGGQVEYVGDGVCVATGFRVAVIADYDSREYTLGHGVSYPRRIVAAPDASRDEIAAALVGV